MTLSEILPIFELVSYVVTIIGFPLAITVYYFDHKQTHEDSKLEAFNHSSDRYVEFLTLIVNYPKLDLFPNPKSIPKELTEEELEIESSLLAILFDMFEKAYVLYHDGEACIHKEQWQGWQGTIISYCHRANFSREWQSIGQQFDKNFVQCVEKLKLNTATIKNN